MEQAVISVTRTGYSDPMEFRAETVIGSSAFVQRITLSNDQFQRLTNGLANPEALVEAALRFLLDRISAEKIAERFDLPAIGQYFPDFELELKSYLAAIKCASPPSLRACEGAAEVASSMNHSTDSPHA